MKKIGTKIMSIFLAFVLICSTMGVVGSAAAARKLDIAFVIDTTASMGDDINIVKARMTEYLDDLEASGNDYKIAIVDYRDFPERAGYEDYAYKVQLNFSSDYDAIVSAINGLTLGYGGDGNETVYSALIDGLDELSWRDDAGKCAILMGDAPALDPEPYTGYTLETTINKLKYNSVAPEEDYGDVIPASRATAAEEKERSAVQVFAIATTAYDETVENFAAIAEGTGGKSYTVTSDTDVGEIIDEIIEVIPEVVEPVEPEETELTFFEKVLKFFYNLYLILTFRCGETDWNF